MEHRAIIHIDLDAFFVQVERSRNPALLHVPMAVQQHQDTIAISYEARQLGIKKHTHPIDIRAKFPQVQLVHVHTISGKASYKYYRLASKAIFSVVKEFGFPTEQRGMDEAYLDVTSVISEPTRVISSLLQVASGIAAKLKSAVESKTGYVCSCGVGTNKLLAKLASRKAKPNGISCIHNDDWDAIARELRVESLPQCGGQVADLLADRFKAVTCSDASVVGLDDLVGCLGLKKAHMLYDACRGQDLSPVMPTAAAKSLQSQCSITPLVLVQHEGMTGLDDNHLGLLEPTPPWSVDRITRIVDILANDLAERIEEDAEENNRHATSLTLSLQMLTCSPTEVGHFGIPCGAPAGAAASRVRPAHVSQVYEGAVVVWPSHQFVPSLERTEPPEPALVWNRASTDLVKKTGQVTSRSVVFPLDAYEEGRSTAARAASILQSAQKIYLAAALAAAESDGWWWNGITAAASKTVVSCFPQHEFQQSSDGTVPGVGGATKLGKIDWMSHPLGTSNSPLKSWVNRFTLPLSVVKIALAATNFKAGPAPRSVLNFLQPRAHLSPSRPQSSPERLSDGSRQMTQATLSTTNSMAQAARGSAERNRDSPKRTTQMTLAGQKRLREASTPPTPAGQPLKNVELVVLASQSSGDDDDVQFIGAEDNLDASAGEPMFPAKLSAILEHDLRAGGSFVTPDLVAQIWKSVG